MPLVPANTVPPRRHLTGCQLTRYTCADPAAPGKAELCDGGRPHIGVDSVPSVMAEGLLANSVLDRRNTASR